jgi:hypothetical protein
MASASATTPLIGALLFKFGLTDMIIAIVAAWLIGFIPAGLFSEMGREVPLSGLVVARKTYGWDGSLLFSVLFSLVNLGWFGLNTEVGAEILAAITHSSVYLWDVIVGGLQLTLVLFGMKWLERFYRYTVLILIAAYLAPDHLQAVHHVTVRRPVRQNRRDRAAGRRGADPAGPGRTRRGYRREDTGRRHHGSVRIVAAPPGQAGRAGRQGPAHAGAARR